MTDEQTQEIAYEDACRAIQFEHDLARRWVDLGRHREDERRKFNEMFHMINDHVAKLLYAGENEEHDATGGASPEPPHEVEPEDQGEPDTHQDDPFDASISYLAGVPDSVKRRLMDGPARTIRELAEWLDAGNDLQTLKGIGQTKASRIIQALKDYMADHNLGTLQVNQPSGDDDGDETPAPVPEDVKLEDCPIPDRIIKAWRLLNFSTATDVHQFVQAHGLDRLIRMTEAVSWEQLHCDTSPKDVTSSYHAVLCQAGINEA